MKYLKLFGYYFCLGKHFLRMKHIVPLVFLDNFLLKQFRTIIVNVDLLCNLYYAILELVSVLMPLGCI